MAARSRDRASKRVTRKVRYIEDLDDSDQEGREKNENNKSDDSDNERIDKDDSDHSVSPESDNDNESNYESDGDVRPSRKRRRLVREKKPQSDDSDFHSGGSASEGVGSDAEFDEDEAYMARLREKQFIASDDDDDAYHKPRTRTERQPAEEDDSIHQEIQELYDLSPDESPVKHKLREREKIDYTIPPPITHENERELYAVLAPSPLRRKKQADFRRLLFPTAGPFGGSDVVSVLGQNIPPGGIPIPGMPGDMGAVAVGNADSDSSDDDMKDPGTFGLKPNVVNHTKIVGAQADGKRKNTLSDTDPLGVDMNIDFDAVGGLDGYIDQLKEMVALPLLYPELYQNFGITPPRGVLFHGPPGTGKTLMARALAASCSTPTRKITFFMRKGADCLSKWVGEAERQLRLLFEEAKNQQPAIIFFDEIDGLAPVRLSKQEQIHASIVSTLLALMDGMDNRGQVIVIGATNRPDSVDPALRRPGRFDREFYFPLPDLDARKQILKIHTRKWTPPLSSDFLDKVAALTKGYGGADLRALCTEAALNSIQRKYPQIYLSNDKLQVDPTKVRVVARDFMRAIDKIVPSSARSASTSLSPLSERLQPLLQESLDRIVAKLNDLLPDSVGIGKKKLLNLDEAMYLDPTLKDHDGGFLKHQLLKSLESSRICKPHLLICGERGSGQQYLGAAILNLLEGFQVQNLDLAAMFGDVTRTPELCIVQTFIEARRHQPSIIFIPNIDTWFDVMPHSAKATLSGLLRNLRSNEKILLLGIADRTYDELDTEIKMTLGFLGELNSVTLTNPTVEARRQFFSAVENALMMKPYEFLNDLENRPRRKLKQLPVVPQENTTAGTESKKRRKQQEYDDKKLKNILKIKLAGLMDLFKNRYKRFKKPIIDDSLLHHLFEPSVLENPLIPYEVAYVVAKDPEHKNMIQELATGKHFYNMDLDTIEERIWNGYYSEAKQFLKDIKTIVHDSITSGDRERILKANEMLTNAQFGIDDFNNPEFATACKDMRAREVERQAKLVEEHQRLQEEFEKKQQSNLELFKDGSMLNGHGTPVQLLVEDATAETKMLGVQDLVDSNEVDEADTQKADVEAEKDDVEDRTGEAEANVEENVEVEMEVEVKKDTDSLKDVDSLDDANAEDVDNEVDQETTAKDKDDTETQKQGVVAETAIVTAAEADGAESAESAESALESQALSNGTLVSDHANGNGQVLLFSQEANVLDIVPHSESESEAEEDVSIDLKRELVIPPHTQDLFQQEMVHVTERFTVEQLEYFVSRLMEIIWADRGQWDKTATVAKLQDVTRQL